MTFLALQIDYFIYIFRFQAKKAHEIRCKMLRVCRKQTSQSWQCAPYIGKRGLCRTADISSPAVQILRIFSHLGRYGACSE